MYNHNIEIMHLPKITPLGLGKLDLTWLKARMGFWQRLTISQRVSLASLLIVLFILPLTVIVALGPVGLFPRAFLPATPPITPPITPPVTPTPTPSPVSRVFVTSLSYNGNLGGLVGADAKCQERANAANLGGTWKAWLSDNTTSVSSRFIHSNIPYKLLDGTIIANNWRDLTDGQLFNTITLTETKTYHGNYVWTGTNEKGEIHNPGTSKCMEWTALSNKSPLGPTGHSGYTDYRWTWGSTWNCANQYPLYCFEQVVVPTPSPTPTPISNNSPVITTKTLPVGWVGKIYRAWIEGYDLDLNDNLTMTIKNLPPGISQGPCNTGPSGDKKQIRCQISGRPTRQRTYGVFVFLQDNRGGKAEKNLILRILGKGR